MLMHSEYVINFSDFSFRTCYGRFMYMNQQLILYETFIDLKLRKPAVVLFNH